MEKLLTDDQCNDIYNLIIDFFSRYFDKGDFLSKKRYGAKNHYMINYNGEEVLLHWANQDQYYIKTDEFFKNYSFKVGDLQVSFKIKEAETESNNNKGEKKYFIPANGHTIEAQKGNVLTIWFQYRTLSEEEKKKYSTRNIQDELIQEVIKKIDTKNNGWKATLLKSNGDGSSLLEKHLKRYMNKNTCDFFIHKNLRGFLNHELEFFIKNEVLDLDEMELMDEQYLRLSMAKAKAIRGICQKIIEFLAQIEEFQKRLFEKKKFVIRTDYCMTLDKVPEEFYSEIGGNEQQAEEWTRLFKLEFGKVNRMTLDADFLKSHSFLVLDTKFFPQDFKDRLLGHFENLDEAIGGLMIKSESFQALNLLMEKYRESVKCIYIDPPYNTGNDEFIYKDNYQHSSWLTLMDGRLELVKYYLNNEGIIWISVDDHEQKRLGLLLDSIFGNDNFLGNVVWQHSIQGKGYLGKFSIHHNYLQCYCKYTTFSLGGLERTEEHNKAYSNPDNDPKGDWRPGDVRNALYRPNLIFDIITPSGKVIPPPEKGWRWSKETIENKIASGEIIFSKDETRIIRKIYLKNQVERVPETIWFGKEVGTTREANNEMKSLFGGQNPFETPKPSELIERISQISLEEDGILLDFFAGSGSTGQGLLNYNIKHNSNCRYILVEMAEYFDTVMKPRIEKLMYSKEWKDGKPISKEGISHMFKYQYLEQYEDTLNNILFSDLSKTAQETLSEFDDYFLKYMLDYETRESPARLALKHFENPFDYKLKITSGGEEQIETVDLVETFNYLIGIEVERIRVFVDSNRKYRVIFGRKEDYKIAVIWRSTEGINYEKDRDFIEKTILKNEKFNSIYINGDSLILGAKPIEPEFKRLMGA